MTKAIALPALPAAWTVAWPELPIPQSVQIIAVDAEGKPTLERPNRRPARRSPPVRVPEVGRSGCLGYLPMQCIGDMMQWCCGAQSDGPGDPSIAGNAPETAGYPQMAALHCQIRGGARRRQNRPTAC